MVKTRAATQVLSALQVLDAPYGTVIAQHTGMKAPTVYRVLHRMLDEAWVVARKDGRRLRYYLTPLGASWAAAWAAPTSSGVIRVRRKADWVRVLHWTGANLDTVMAFVGADAVYEDGTLYIVTPDTRERCTVGDWIIEGVNNFWRVTSQEFQAMFEMP